MRYFQWRAGFGLLLGLALALTALVTAAQAASRGPSAPAAPAAPAAPTGAIAYLHPQDNGTTDFHLIQPDGSGDHIFATLPISASQFVPELAWKPDATELAFTSNFEEATSFWHSDIYAIRPNGSGLRRITNGPDPSAFANYQKGSVTVQVNAPSGGPFLVYLDGAPSPQVVTAGSHTLTFNNVAVFPGRLQRLVGIFGLERWFTPGVGAILQAGQTVNATGALNISGSSSGDPGASNLSWRSDGAKIGFRFLECCYYSISANPAELDTGSNMLSPFGFTLLIDYNPLPAKATQFLYTSADVLNGNTIALTTEGQGEGQALVSTGYMYRTIRDLKWLPDGSGFVYAEDELNDDQTLVVASNLYVYIFATGQSTPITHFTNEYAAHLSVSPDGQQIVFEHSADNSSVDGLWLVNRDGSNPHVFVAGPDVGRPAWSRVAPVVQPQSGSSRLLLPFLRK